MPKLALAFAFLAVSAFAADPGPTLLQRLKPRARGGVVAAPAADPGGRATYLGGTTAGLEANADGEVQTASRDMFVFVSRNSTVSIPYSKINQVEYGQEVGRRVILAYVASPLFLLLKARKHFITLEYRDEADAQQTMVLRVDKLFVRPALAILEARTGCSIRYQDEDARRFRRD